MTNRRAVGKVPQKKETKTPARKYPNIKISLNTGKKTISLEDILYQIKEFAKERSGNEDYRNLDINIDMNQKKIFYSTEDVGGPDYFLNLNEHEIWDPKNLCL